MNRFSGILKWIQPGSLLVRCLVVLVVTGLAVQSGYTGPGSQDSLAIGDTLPDSSGLAADTAVAVDSSAMAGADTAGLIIEAPMPDYVPFGEGERFVYSVQYGIINAGEAILEIKNIAEIDGVPCYRIVSDARTNRVFSKIFKVRDHFESFMDTSNLVSKYYEKHLREGKYKKDEVVKFDQEAHLAIYKDREVPIPPRTQDVLSALYYVRTLPLETGQSFAVSNHTNGKNYPLVIKVLRRERVSVEAGSFNCIVVEPLLRSAGLFKHKGRLTVWLTDDKYRIPVLMESKVVIGAISAVLKDYRLAKKVQYAEQVQRRGSL